MLAQSVGLKRGGNVLTVSTSSGLLNPELSCGCRSGDEHPLRNGDGPIRHDWPADVYPGSGDRSGDGTSGARK